MSAFVICPAGNQSETKFFAINMILVKPKGHPILGYTIPCDDWWKDG